MISLVKNNINYYKVISLSLFLIFNFINRDMSNIFLLATLLLCLIDFRGLRKALVEQKSIILAIIVFSIWIGLVGFYHTSPMHELDNYFRFLLLLPLLSITLTKESINTVLIIGALGGMLHLLISTLYFDIDRYEGTSSNAITYANLCALFFMVSIYNIFTSQKSKKTSLLIVSSIIFLYLYILTETRGPIIGITFGLIFLIYILKSKWLLIISILLFSSVALIPNTLVDRLKYINQINIAESHNIKQQSLRERMYYLNFGIMKIKSNSLFGIGPQNLERDMSYELDKAGIINVKSRDHLHNDFLDISSKFGIVSVFFMLFIYYSILRNSHKDYKSLSILVLIMLISSQLTQSHFAHHQAISFFIVVLFTFIKKNSLKNNKNDI